MDYFETGMFGGNEKAWHGMGNVVPADVVTAEEAITLGGLDWEVTQEPIFVELPQRGWFGQHQRVQIPEYVANVRSTDLKVLGVVGQNYVPVQNRGAFSFMDTLLASGDAKYHTVGSLKGGKRIWLLARLNRDILIGGEESERIAPFVLLCNGHDGSMGLIVVVTPVRVVCWNTLSMALANAKRMWYTKHTKNVLDRVELAQDAADTLGLSYRFFDQLEAVGNKLIMEPMATNEFEGMLKRLIPLPRKKDDTDVGGRAFRSREEARQVILNIFRSEPNLANIRGTKWAAVQAVAQYEDHVKRVMVGKGGIAIERRFERAILEPDLKVKALAMVAPEAVSRSTRNRLEREEASLVEVA